MCFQMWKQLSSVCMWVAHVNVFVSNGNILSFDCDFLSDTGAMILMPLIKSLH